MTIARAACVFLFLVTFSSTTHGAGLDDFYLQKYGLSGLAKALAPGGEQVADRCRTWLHHDLKRDWDKLQPETQKALAKVLPARPALANEAAVISAGGHFKIHYATSGGDAPPLADGNGNGTPDWVETVADVFENVFRREVTEMGYQPPPTIGGQPYDVYLRDVGRSLGEFGETVSDAAAAGSSTSFTSYMVIDNDFSAAEFGNQITNFTSQKALEVTAAHEFHHAIQYGYNFFFESWYAEATSTWMEDEVYDEVNQLYSYLTQYMAHTTASLDAPVSVATGGGYGRWIFNRHLAERFGASTIREIWEVLKATSPSGGNDIPMLPIINAVLSGKGSSLDSTFFDFTKRFYKRDWSTHTSEIQLIHPVSPVAAYTTYPVTSGSSPAPAVTLPHYAFAYYFFRPSTTSPSNLVVNIAKTNGIDTSGFSNSGGTISDVSATSSASIQFPLSGITEDALLICNKSAADNQSANFSTDGNPPQAVTSAGGDGGGGGCFIATAAFGSYLHPKVQILRQFRDEYLMTSPLGRAFVRCYYHLSPPVADFIARHETLRALCRVLLLPVIAAVQHLYVSLALLVVSAMAGATHLLFHALRRRPMGT